MRSLLRELLILAGVIRYLVYAQPLILAEVRREDMNEHSCAVDPRSEKDNDAGAVADKPSER